MLILQAWFILINFLLIILTFFSSLAFSKTIDFDGKTLTFIRTDDYGEHYRDQVTGNSSNIYYNLYSFTSPYARSLSNDLSNTYLSIENFEINCSNQTVRSGSLYYYNSNGRLNVSFPPLDNFNRIVANSINDLIHRSFC